MKQYRKKPVVVQAYQLENTPLSILKALLWIGVVNDERNRTLGEKVTQEMFDRFTTPDGIIIQTLEGDHLASWGDYIIKGTKGEFYPCKPDIFVGIYDEVTE